MYTTYRDTNWNSFQCDTNQEMERLMPSTRRNLSNQKIDNLISEFNNTISTLHTNHSTSIEILDSKFPLSGRTRNLYKMKHQWQKELKKIFHKCGNRLSREYAILSKQIQLLKVIIKESVNIEQAKHFSSRLENIKPGPSAFKEIYRISGKRKSPFYQRIIHNNNIITNTNEIVELFQNHFSSTFQHSSPQQPVADLDARISSVTGAVPEHIYSFDSSFQSLNNTYSFHFIKAGEVRNFVNNINNKKSCGPDGLSNFITKNLPETAFTFLTIIFNNCINNGYFPTAWKAAKIIPIKKKTDSETVSDFRPISLLSNIGKVLERIRLKKAS